MANESNCYACVHRGNVPGDTHSSCQHPDAQDKQMAILYALLAGYAGYPLKLSETVVVCCSLHGVLSGWCNYPVNFDPIWIESCTGFTKRENTSESS